MSTNVCFLLFLLFVIDILRIIVLNDMGSQAGGVIANFVFSLDDVALSMLLQLKLLIFMYLLLKSF